jgi:hypothetical protein
LARGTTDEIKLERVTRRLRNQAEFIAFVDAWRKKHG